MPMLPDWVTTPETQLASTAVRRAAAAFGSPAVRDQVSPLFLHGPAGTGKTRLVQALAAEITRRWPDGIVSVVAAGDCRPDPDEALPAPAARDLPDLLVVEDLHHLPVFAHERLAWVLDARRARRLLTVVTATVGPARLVGLPARLRGRLAAGLVVGLEPLAPASRAILLDRLAGRRKLALDPAVRDWLAGHLGPSVRQIEGALTRLQALAVHGHGLDLAAVQAAFEPEAHAARPSVERIAERVGHFFRVEPRQMRSRRRGHNALLPRQVGMYLARRLTCLSLQQIGAYFGGRDHSTVRHACRKVEEAMASDHSLSGAVRQLHADLA